MTEIANSFEQLTGPSFEEYRAPGLSYSVRIEVLTVDQIIDFAGWVREHKDERDGNRWWQCELLRRSVPDIFSGLTDEQISNAPGPVAAIISRVCELNGYGPESDTVKNG